MRKFLAFVLAFGLTLIPLWGTGPAPATAGAPLAVAAQDQSSYQDYTDEQLDNLLAPIALYPDPLLAQVLVAATFPDQIDEAARWVRSYGQNGVDDQPWDVSVRAVAHYPSVLEMMDDNLDWTTAVGQAYVYQSTDVMASVQRLREMAEQQGNLVNTPQEQVVVDNGYIEIWPASPEYIYVPIYDPSIVFFRRAYFGGVFTGFSFGPAFAIGAWLNLDCDWANRRVYYTGWQGPGWIARSRPHIQISSIYVNSRYRDITVNRDVTQRPVNYDDLSRYQSVHGNVNFQNRRPAGQTAAPSPTGRVPNKIIDRNIIPNQQMDQFRGRQQPSPAPEARPTPMPQQPSQNQEPVQQRPTPSPQVPRAFPQVRQPTPAPAQRPRTAMPPIPPAPQPPNAFGRGDGAFSPQAASQRGQQSRQQMNQRPAARPAPPRPAPAARQPSPARPQGRKP